MRSFSVCCDGRRRSADTTQEEREKRVNVLRRRKFGQYARRFRCQRGSYCNNNMKANASALL
jgi:hypothetical protein